jgi:hypothetical protein
MHLPEDAAAWQMLREPGAALLRQAAERASELRPLQPVQEAEAQERAERQRARRVVAREQEAAVPARVSEARAAWLRVPEEADSAARHREA